MRRLAVALFLVSALPLAAQHQRAARPPAAPTPASWLQNAAIHLSSVTPANDDADLMPLLPYLANARVVAFGDATHGTHEFFTMKQRLVPFLIARAGFRVVAFEAPFEWEKLDDYVKTGNGDPASLLKSDDYFFWNTQEILDLMIAIRAWNAGGNPQVTVAGIDSVHPTGATDDVVNYLRPIDAAASTTATSSYTCVNANWYTLTMPGDPLQCEAQAKAVYDGIVANADAYARATSADAYAHALHAARVAVQSAEGIATRRDNRDAAMAENAEWYAARDKVIVIGHQTHFGRSNYDFGGKIAPLKSAGGYLNDLLGSAYMTFATATLHGTFNAGVWAKDHYATTVYSYDGTNTFASVLAVGGVAKMIVPFRQPLPSWIAGNHDLPIASSVAAGALSPVIDIDDDPTKAYDGVLYIETTSAAAARQ